MLDDTAAVDALLALRVAAEPDVLLHCAVTTAFGDVGYCGVNKRDEVQGAFLGIASGTANKYGSRTERRPLARERSTQAVQLTRVRRTTGDKANGFRTDIGRPSWHQSVPNAPAV